jgi:hypothetical protein
MPMMRVSSQIGHVAPNRNWGYVEKCPYCSATNIKRVSKKQITCGKPACRNARRKAKGYRA